MTTGRALATGAGRAARRGRRASGGSLGRGGGARGRARPRRAPRGPSRPRRGRTAARSSGGAPRRSGRGTASRRAEARRRRGYRIARRVVHRIVSSAEYRSSGITPEDSTTDRIRVGRGRRRGRGGEGERARTRTGGSACVACGSAPRRARGPDLDEHDGAVPQARRERRRELRRREPWRSRQVAEDDLRDGLVAQHADRRRGGVGVARDERV